MNDAVDAYKDTLRKINFPNYDYYVNRAYSDSFQKLVTVIDNVAPCKAKRIKRTLKIGLTKKYLKNFGQGTNTFKHSRK